MPVVFGERQKERIEAAFRGEWQFRTVEMVKKSGVWYAHFVLARVVAFSETETVVAMTEARLTSL